jgi:hypothetical protein
VAGGWLPRSASGWIAASLIGGSKWHAGEPLMQESSPASWATMARLYDACGHAGDRAVRGGDRGADRSVRARGRKECIRAGTLTSSMNFTPNQH